MTLKPAPDYEGFAAFSWQIGFNCEGISVRHIQGKPLLLALSLMVGTVTPGALLAHGGGLNADGCHNNRKTGDYHCHRPAAPKAEPLYTIPDQGSGAFRNCAAARAAGATPVRIGDPGYGPHLDRDRDGIGCE